MTDPKMFDRTNNISNNADIRATNFLPKVRLVNIDYGDIKTVAQFEPGECRIIRIDAKLKAPRITFASETTVPSYNGLPSHDTRALGIYIHSISYV